MTDYAAEYRTKSSPAWIAKAVARTRQIDAMYGAWFRKYHGGLPVGALATFTYWESNGQPGTVGDASLGEIGLLQIAAYVPPLFGLPASSRSNPETNVFLAGLEYAYEAARWKLKYPGYVSLGNLDNYKLARLSFSVGAGGAWGLAANAINGGFANGRNLYDAISAYVDTTGGSALGSQSAAQVWWRVKAVAIQFEIAAQVGGFFDFAGPPVRIPAPAGITYTLPASVAPLFGSGFPWTIFGAVAAGGYLLWRIT